MLRHAARAGAALVLVACGACWLALPAHAQSDERIPAQARLQLGPYDAALGDWTVRGVQLTGGLLDGKRVAVDLLGTDGTVLGESETDFSPPATVLTFDPPVPIGAIASIRLGQQGFAVATAPLIVAPAAASAPEQPPPPPEVRSETFTIPPPKKASSAVQDVVSRGVSSTPRLAVSLIVLLVVFALVFRLPLLPVGGQARWRR
jgi:hypothetical protein